jgi:toxin ParE1/3/4
MAFLLHPEAIDDLDEIHEYLSRHNESAADRVLDELFGSFGSIAAAPGIGFRKPELTLRPLRFRVIRNYLIAYASEQNPIWILAIIDGRRSPRVLAAILRGRA